jgi:hypothetical protein
MTGDAVGVRNNNRLVCRGETSATIPVMAKPCRRLQAGALARVHSDRVPQRWSERRSVDATAVFRANLVTGINDHYSVSARPSPKQTLGSRYFNGALDDNDVD